ncbi:hypothetical protein B0H14DRAFT_2627301 [Mycena olivaceomarginata]|nr:hypothetical protein B0H14DRAFT_2627301 [Mycena olivaceomarginata]
MVGCCALVILLCLINPVPIDVHVDNIRDLLICADTKGAAADHDLGFTSRPVMKTYGTGFIRCVAAIATNSIVVNENVDLPPRDLNKMINLVNKSIQCGPVTAKVNADLDGSVHAVASVGVAAQGTITPKAHRRGAGRGTERKHRRHFVADRRHPGELSANQDESQMWRQRFTEPIRGNAWSSPRQRRIPTNEIGLSDQERFHGISIYARTINLEKCSRMSENIVPSRGTFYHLPHFHTQIKGCATESHLKRLMVVGDQAGPTEGLSLQAYQATPLRFLPSQSITLTLQSPASQLTRIRPYPLAKRPTDEERASTEPQGPRVKAAQMSAQLVPNHKAAPTTRSARTLDVADKVAQMSAHSSRFSAASSDLATDMSGGK